MILTFSSLLLQAPSLCSEKLSDEPLRAQKCSPRCSEGAPGAPRSFPPTHLERSAASPEPLEPSKNHLRSHLTVQSHLRRLHKASRSSLDRFRLTFEALGASKTKVLRNSLILTFSCSCSKRQRSGPLPHRISRFQPAFGDPWRSKMLIEVAHRVKLVGSTSLSDLLSL